MNSANNMLSAFACNQQFDVRSTLCVAGDLVLDLPDADHWLSGIAPLINDADAAIAHLEVPHSDSHDVLKGDVPAPGAPPENIAAIARAGFSCVTLAGNHIADCGPQGIEDTIRELSANNILGTGAGLSLKEARAPAIFESGGKSIAVLSYNCVGPQIAWADEGKAGCAYLPTVAADGNSVAPASDIIGVSDEAREILNSDIAAARADGADYVFVALHKGKVHTPAFVGDYERTLSHMAVDAGCDLVLGHHAHIIRGVEFYNGTPIFHGLGNACVVTTALSPGQDDPARAAWVERRKALFGFEPDPSYTYAPFHPEAVNAMIGTVALGDNGQLAIGFVPVFIEAPGRPVIATGERRKTMIEYFKNITRSAGLGELTLKDFGDVVQVMHG